MTLIDPERVLLHVGVPKSATTTLQVNLFAALERAVYLGKPYDRPGVPYGSNAAIAELVDALWTRTEPEFDRAHAARLLERGLADRPGIGDPGSTVVLSEEALTWAGAADRLEIARRLRRLFGRCRVLITIREQRAALRSCHRWMHARRLINEPHDAWIARCLDGAGRACRPDDFAIRHYRFGELIAAYRRLFGDERVAVLATEQLRADPDDAARTLAPLLPCDERTVRERLESGAVQNASPGRLGTAYQRAARLARAMTRGPDWTDPLALAELDRGVHGVAMRTLATIDRPPAPASPRTDRALADYFRASNRLASDLTGLPLHELGYAL